MWVLVHLVSAAAAAAAAVAGVSTAVVVLGDGVDFDLPNSIHLEHELLLLIV